MIEKIILFLANFLLERLIAAAQAKFEQVQEERARDRINEANTKAYEEATDEVSRRKAALDLLNRRAP